MSDSSAEANVMEIHGDSEVLGLHGRHILLLEDLCIGNFALVRDILHMCGHNNTCI